MTTTFAVWLWAETRGLPFFIEALLQMLVEQDILSVTKEGQPTYDFAVVMEHVRSVAHVPLPPGVREVIQARLAQHFKAGDALLLAALLDEPAFRYSVAAGSEAFASYATQEALAHFNTARDVAHHMQERGASIDPNLLGRLYRERGQATDRYWLRQSACQG